MSQSIGVGIITRNSSKTIRACIESFIKHVDQCVVTLAGENTDDTEAIVNELAGKHKHLEVNKFEWIDNFAAARNFNFSHLKTDWVFWCDSDDTVFNAENLRLLAENAQSQIGGIWFPYYYANDEFGNITTVYERERLLRSSFGWIWKGRLHETVSPLKECQYVRTNDVITKHNHTAGESRNDRNFRILEIMHNEDPGDRRVWLYLGHQNFAAQNWLRSAEWYLRFGQDNKAVAIERWQALCYCSRALRELRDRQAVDVALMAIDLFPQYKDGYLELAQSYFAFGEHDKAIHFAKMSDVKELVVEPPAVIFINPLDYTFNKYCLLAECYAQKGELKTSLEYLKQANAIRPTQEMKAAVERVDSLILQERVGESMKILAVHLLNNQELLKLRQLPHIAPFWWRETPDYAQLKQGVEQYTSNIENKPEFLEGENKSVMVNVGNAYNLKALLDGLDEKYDKVTVVAPMPAPNVKIINPMSQSDIENLIMSSEGRHITNLQTEPNRIICEYDRKPVAPKGLSVRIYVGQGLEYWSPKTIKEQGCGGSETSAAWLAKEFAKRGSQPIVYAMDNQIWDGVIYRHYSKFSPQTLSPHHLFISSRVPEVLVQGIPAKQKWLWVHDIHCWDRLTPEIASEIDVIVALSHWHVEHLKRTYPYLKDAEVIDLDDQDKSYDDLWTPHVFYKDDTCYRVPKIAIIGDALDTSRFENISEERIPYRFIYCSSPDRGLEQILDLWVLIKEKMPLATLKIFYGWNYFNSSLHIKEQRELKEKIRELVQQDGIEWCNRIGQDALAHELLKADAMLYPPPHDFRETYGIAFLEAQAAGVICFYRQNGALGETINKRGIALRNDMTPTEIVNIIADTLGDKNGNDIIRKEAMKYARQRDWGGQCEKMLKLYNGLEEEHGAENRFIQGGGVKP